MPSQVFMNIILSFYHTLKNLTFKALKAITHHKKLKTSPGSWESSSPLPTALSFIYQSLESYCSSVVVVK